MCIFLVIKQLLSIMRSCRERHQRSLGREKRLTITTAILLLSNFMTSVYDAKPVHKCPNSGRIITLFITLKTWSVKMSRSSPSGWVVLFVKVKRLLQSNNLFTYAQYRLRDGVMARPLNIGLKERKNERTTRLFTSPALTT